MEKQPVPELQQVTDAAVLNTQNGKPIKPEDKLLLDEFKELTEKFGDQFPTICSFIKKETTRIEKGFKSAEEEKTLDIEAGKPIRMTYKVTIPTEKYPNFNYVGRLLGPKGSTLKGMQEISGCKLAVLGRSSMRDKEQEARCRAEGGKYAHLNEPLHVWMQAFGTPDIVFYKLYVACKEVKKYLHADYNDDIFNEQMAMLEQEGGLPKGYTAARAAAPRNMRGVPHRGMVPNRGGLPIHRSLLANVGMARGNPHLTARGSMRGEVPRGRGGYTRGTRGARGGPHRTTSSGPAIATETLIEDVYEPAAMAPTTNAATFLNGSAVNNSNAYFDEFPEPGLAAGGDGTVPGFQRQAPNSKNIKLQQKNHHPAHTAVSSAAATSVQQRAY